MHLRIIILKIISEDMVTYKAGRIDLRDQVRTIFYVVTDFSKIKLMKKNFSLVL